MLENVLYGNPARCHDPVGWPTFKGWPHHDSLTHEQSYYSWLERAWMGGLRVFVNLFVENRVLCELYPMKQNSCDEMDLGAAPDRESASSRTTSTPRTAGPARASSGSSTTRLRPVG